MRQQIEFVIEIEFVSNSFDIVSAINTDMKFKQCNQCAQYIITVYFLTLYCK